MTGDMLIPPAGADQAGSDALGSCVEIPLGGDVVSSCNIALGDIDGDGLQELAIPITCGERDAVRLYRGDGELLWENREVRFYHAWYRDPSPPPVGHMWYRSRHRHLLTEVCDVDGDGALEVVVGDGPIHVLDARTGRLKVTLDLGGGVALWAIVQAGSEEPKRLIATVDDRAAGPAVLAADISGAVAWRVPTPGRAFCDCIRAGDLTGDGRPEIGFSIDDVGQFWIVDCAGNVLWTKDVARELGPDEHHVDDFVIDRITPSGAPEGNQIVCVPGPNLLDRQGNTVWTRRDSFEHAQSVRVGSLLPDRQDKQVYTVEKHGGRAALLSGDGELLWTYDSFTKVREGVEGAGILLTTAGDAINWSGQGRREIVQAELAYFAANAPLPDGPITLYVHVLDGQGRQVALLPYRDDPAPGFVGAMCARAANMTNAPEDDIVVVTHNSGRVLIFSTP